MTKAETPRVPYVVYNPAKVTKLHALRKLVTLGARQAGMAEPVWIQTTPEDPGTGQAVQAVGEGAALVIAAGGDGTVRAVAAALAGTSIPMAILPYGTGNLLGRNLKVPPDDMQEAVDIAFFGRESTIDLAWMKLSGVEGDLQMKPEGALIPSSHHKALVVDDFQAPGEDEYAFLVVAGQGWDAHAMSGTDADLKEKVGWAAYVVSGVKSLKAPKIKAYVTLDDDERYVVTGRSLLFANCASLLLGVVLAPDAELDDGLMDVAVLETTDGPFGWIDLFTKIGLQGLGVKKETLPGTSGQVEFKQARKVSSRVRKAHPIQVDGDVLGRARGMDVRVDRQALLMRQG